MSSLKRLYIVNGSGVFSLTLSLRPVVETVTTSCRASGGGVAIGWINTSYGIRIVVLSSPTMMCIIDPYTHTVDLVDLPNGLARYAYTSIAMNGTHVFMNLVSITNGTVYLVAYGSKGFEVLGVMPSPKVLGMSYRSSYKDLVFVIEGGPIYLYKLGKGVSVLVSSIPFYPKNPGDRLCWYSGYTVFVRDDGTLELWVFRTG